MSITKTLSFCWLTLGALSLPLTVSAQEYTPIPESAPQLMPGTKQLLNSLSANLTTPPKQLIPKKNAIKHGGFKGDRPKAPGTELAPATTPSAAEVAAAAISGEAPPPKPAIDITVQKQPKPDAIVENILEKAYRAILAGQNEVAISLYKQVSQAHPDNANALFGLATSYQRNQQIEQARAAYTDLLTRHPRHRQGLNNFLALAAEEAPQEALAEFRNMERANPDFSPVIAQIAMLYAKLGDQDQALRYLNRAITLSPENTVYRYNLAVLLDKMGHYPEAAKLYRQVIAQANENNVALPVQEAAIVERLGFVSVQ